MEKNKGVDDEGKLGRLLVDQAKGAAPIYLFLDYYLKNGTGLSVITDCIDSYNSRSHDQHC